ncbi:hypothetical protein BJ875DRAFT_200972 [Amylocarpus encephaloides]|uniref:GRAM domain-containing protein n=1 Tax=Amylocarpus encephaloides TaxID=45428 RepID=A0A9P8C0Z8_9HELO|nr:hypothetical protein BJ875DRAFT_200972 [Amylocarpus encephaloides]
MYQFHQDQTTYTLLAAQTKKLKTKSWVMTQPGSEGFIKLPNEQILYTSPPRISIQLSSPNTYPAAQPYSAKSESGVVYITNQRIIYLPSTPTNELQSFSAPILNLQDTFVRAPFFGANYWTATVKPVPDGGIPATHSAVELRFTFKEGGAFDYHTVFEQIKERLYQAYTIARETGHNGVAGSDLTNVNLEQLPAYEAGRDVETEIEEPRILSPVPVRPTSNNTAAASRAAGNPPAPDEPPPGYEEAQVQAVGNGLEQRLRQEQN